MGGLDARPGRRLFSGAVILYECSSTPYCGGMVLSDWVSLGALAVAVVGVVIGVSSARSARRSADASRVSAGVAVRQHARALARDGIVEFGPWRAEAFSSGALEVPCWRFVNVSDRAVHDLVVEDSGTPWNLAMGEVVEPEGFAVDTYPEGYTRTTFPYQVVASWREGSASAPKTTAAVWICRPERP